MKLHIYQNRIIAPNKCGTRFLSEIENNKRITIDHFNIFYYKNFDSIVIRNPFEHFKSALHTEVLNMINSDSNVNYEHLIQSYLTPIGSAHWSYELYKTIYDYDKMHNLNVIKLDDLSYAIFEKKNYIQQKYSFEEEFNIWKSKDEIYEEFFNMFPNEMNHILKKIDEYAEFYTYLERKSINFSKKTII